jgi:drug/metabolite transporter (DMT)-like permease
MAPIFVRFSRVGPISTGFWRLALAAIAIGGWRVTRRGPRSPVALPAQPWLSAALIAGVAFGCDLGVWHLSIQLTSVANATLLANLAPIFMLLFAQAFFGERFPPRVWLAIALSFTGVLCLLGGSVSWRVSRGDALGFCTALFYSAYLLCLRRIPRAVPATQVLGIASAVGAIVLLPFALWREPAFWPHDTAGWMVLLGLAGISQLFGQGLITHALPRLPTSLSSAILVCQSAFAAFFGWCLLGERLTWLRAAGALLMLVGIFLVRVLSAERSRRGEPDPLCPVSPVTS